MLEPRVKANDGLLCSTNGFACIHYDRVGYASGFEATYHWPAEIHDVLCRSTLRSGVIR